MTFAPRDFRCASGVTPCALDVPLRGEVERTVDVSAERDGATFTYLVSELTLPRATEIAYLEAAAIGADFDGIDSGMGDGSASATCERFAPDLPSVLEPGVRGVDNQFATSILSSFEDGLDPVGCPGAQTRGCLDWLLHEDLRAGRLLLSVEVRGVDSFEHDPAVEVAVYAVRVPGGGPPALDEDSLAPGQTLETVATLAPPSPGTILHGRLDVSWAELRLPRERFGYPDQLSRPRLRAAICEDGLFHAYLAALTPVDVLAEQWAGARSRFGGTVDSETARGTLEGLADVTPSADDPTVCEQISLAYGLEAVPASRAP